jgi:hypothetical protein
MPSRHHGVVLSLMEGLRQLWPQSSAPGLSGCYEVGPLFLQALSRGCCQLQAALTLQACPACEPPSAPLSVAGQFSALDVHFI